MPGTTNDATRDRRGRLGTPHQRPHPEVTTFLQKNGAMRPPRAHAAPATRAPAPPAPTPNPAAFVGVGPDQPHCRPSPLKALRTTQRRGRTRALYIATPAKPAPTPRATPALGACARHPPRPGTSCAKPKPRPPWCGQGRINPRRSPSKARTARSRGEATHRAATPDKPVHLPTESPRTPKARSSRARPSALSTPAGSHPLARNPHALFLPHRHHHRHRNPGPSRRPPTSGAAATSQTRSQRPLPSATAPARQTNAASPAALAVAPIHERPSLQGPDRRTPLPRQ